MKVAFRVDASTVIGTGHVARCLALAAALRSEGGEVLFVCRTHTGHLCDFIEGKGFKVARLSQAADSLEEGGYAAWLGTTETRDAADTMAAIQADGNRVDWLVVDHYAIGVDWEAAMRPHAARILVVDDLADRSHDCDFLLDQNLARHAFARYDNLVPADCEVLVGLRYCLLGPEYAEQGRRQRHRTGKISKVAVFFGGADLHNLSSMALTALGSSQFAAIAVDVVIGASNRRWDDVLRLAAARPGIQVSGPLPTLVDLWANADLALASSGVSTWERICCGLPALIVTSGDNQLDPVDMAEQVGCVLNLGGADSVTVDMMAAALSLMVADSERVRTMSERCAGMVDGLGVPRVLQAMAR